MSQNENLLFQSGLHPLVSEKPQTRETFVLSLLHSKAYAHAMELAHPATVVLDLGCNDGYGTLTLASRAARAIGVDVSQAAIDTARKLRQRDNIEFRLIDGAALPFSDEMFDLVSSFQVIEHVVEVRPYLEEIKRVLKPGGKVLFTTPNRVIRLDPGMRPWNSFHVREYTAAELSAILREVFPQTTVKGLMAPPELYDIEFARCQRALMGARNQSVSTPAAKTSQFDFLAAVKAVLPNLAIDALRRVRDRLQSAETKHEVPELAQDFVQRWSITDLFYIDDVARIDRALDLLAECRKEERLAH
jgi:SAM-dependent methyltransferase